MKTSIISGAVALSQRPSYARKAAIHHARSRDKSMRKTLVAIGICKVVKK